MNKVIFTLNIRKKLEQLKNTIDALGKEKSAKPMDQFLAEIQLIKNQLDELSDLASRTGALRAVIL